MGFFRQVWTLLRPVRDSLTLDGRQFERRYDPPFGKFAATLTVSVPVVTAGSFQTGPHGGGAIALGLAGAVPTGDGAFDARFVVDADTPALARALFATGPARDAVVALHAIGFREVALAGYTLTATALAPPLELLAPDAARSVAAHLAVLADALDRLGDQGDRPAQRAGFASAFAVPGVLAVLTALPVEWLASRPLDNDRLLWLCVLAALPAAALYAVALRWLLRGRQGAFQAWMLSTMITAVLFGPGAHTAAVWVNAAFDGRAGENVETIALSRFSRAFRSKFVVAPWRGRHDPLTLDAAVFQSEPLACGQPVTLWIKPGALGFPWVAVATPRAGPRQPC